MNTSPTLLSVHAQKLNQSSQFSEANRIILHGPSTVYDALNILEGEMKYFSLARTALLRTVVPEWGGPKVASGKHISSAALEFTRSIPTEYLTHALEMQDRHFKRVQINNSSQCRHRHYLKKLVEEVRDRRWILPDVIKEGKPHLNQINRPRGEHRIYANDIRITTLKRPKSYALGKLEEHYTEIEDERGNKRKVLANEVLEQQLLQISCYVKKVRKNGDAYCLNMLKCILGFLYSVKNIPLSNLTLDRFVPFTQLRFSE